MGAEPRVRTHLLFPILSTLDWKTETNSVEVEYELDNGIADFVLKIKEDPVFVIETKALEKDVGALSDAVTQLLDYMIDLDLHYGSTTNGIVWTLFSRTGRRANLEWSINMLNDNPQYCATLLEQLSKDQIVKIDGNIKLMRRKERILSDTWSQLRSENTELLEILAGILKDKASEIEPEINLGEAKYYLSEQYKDIDFIINAGHIKPKVPITKIGSRIRPKKQDQDRENPQYWLTPVSSTPDEPAEEHLSWLVGEDKMYAYGSRTPGRKKLKPGDWLCFYASGKTKGIIGHARVASKPINKPYSKLQDPNKHPWTFKLDSIRLYTDNPVYVNEELLSKLDFFKNRDVDSYWGYFVVTTRNISEKDFRSLTRNSS